MKKTCTFISVYLLLHIVLSAAECPLLTTLPSNCACEKFENGKRKLVCDATHETDLSAMFNQISDAAGNNLSFNFLFLDYHQTEERIAIPSNVMTRLQFEQIFIFSAWNMTTIATDAFPSTALYTTSLTLTNVWFQEDSADPFPFVRSFTNLKNAIFKYGKLSKIGNYAFENLQYLEYIDFEWNRLKEIGDKPFSSLPKLKSLYLPSNELSADGFSTTTFEGLNSAIAVELAYNSKMTYLPESVFNVLLDTAESTLSVGPIEDLDQNNHLVCDERAEWICKNAVSYGTKLTGFYCTGSQYQDVFEYCAAAGAGGGGGGSSTKTIPTLPVCIGIALVCFFWKVKFLIRN